MNFLFVEKKLRVDKIGPMYISAVLKQAGHEVDLIQDDVDSADEYLATHKVDFVLMSVSTGEHHWFLQKAKELKDKFNVGIIVGGPHFTFFPEDGDVDYIDYIVRGPGEEVILDVVNGKTEKCVRGVLPEDVNKLPFPDRSILYKYDEFGKAGMKRFMAGRDCPNACTYCFNHIYHQLFKDQKHRFFQRISPQSIVDEIVGVKEFYGLKMVYFNDDDLASDKEWLHQFLEEYSRRFTYLPFCGSVRANNMTHMLIYDMAKVGCIFMNIALESANLDTQKLLRRGKINNDTIKIVVKWMQAEGIKVRLQNIIGLPVDDPLEDALETLAFNQDVAPDDSWVAILQPFPKTDIHSLCLRKGLIEPDTECQNFYENTPLKLACSSEINALHKWWYYAVKYKLPIDLVRILIKQPFSKEVAEAIQAYRWKKSSDELYII